MKKGCLYFIGFLCVVFILFGVLISQHEPTKFSLMSIDDSNAPSHFSELQKRTYVKRYNLQAAIRADDRYLIKQYGKNWDSLKKHMSHSDFTIAWETADKDFHSAYR